MTEANLRGGFLKTLTITRTGSHRSYTTLKDDLIKKTSNYVVQIPRFIMNNSTVLSLIDEVMFEILPLGRDGEDPENDNQFVDHILPWPVELYQFRPKRYRTWVELARQLERFFHRFGTTAGLIGFPNFRNKDDQNDYNPVRYAEINDDPDYVQFPFTNVGLTGVVFPYTDFNNTKFDEMPWLELPGTNLEGRHINFTLDDDGRFSLEFDAFFSNYFYIRVGEQTQRKTGFPQYMFVLSDDDDGDASHALTHLSTDPTDPDFDPLTNLFDAIGTFQTSVDNRVAFKQKFTSKYPLENFDDRLSIDVVVAGIPSSTLTTALNGEEEHEYVLARFTLADYEKSATEVIVQGNQLQNTNVIRDILKIGLENLTRGNPDYTSIYMRPGKIRHLNMHLTTRYFSEGKIVSVPTEMNDGIWSLRLLFSKRKT